MKFRLTLPVGELLILVILTTVVMIGAAVWQITAPDDGPPTHYGEGMIVHGHELYTKDGIKIADWLPAKDGADGRWKMLTPQQVYDQQR